ncbi:hypothetical protein [Spiroplasma endosymbiont of Calodromius spilotus]|uniref:hypothetical protein n=1 Tax=Spiroplasma endosymbiont of Calodromius spilotus TaxID=3077929 RepID=UPI0031FF0B3C
MKKILFSNHIFDMQTLNVQDNVCFILGDNSSGKTQILNTLHSGFKGKTKTVKVDEQYINAGDYQVVFLKEFFDIQTEIKISRTSEFRNEIIKILNKFTINDDKYKILLKKLSKISNEIETIINDNFISNLSSIANENIKLRTKLELNSLENVIDKLLKIDIYDEKRADNSIIDDSNYSRFILRMLILNILSSYLEQDNYRPIVFLIDLPELYGTPKLLVKVNSFLKKMTMENNVFLFIATNSPWYLENFCPPIESINLIKKQNIYKFNNSEKTIMEAVIMNSFYESSSNDFVWYKSNIGRVFEAEDLIKEKQYFYNYGFSYFTNAIFTDEVILIYKKQNCLKNENNYIFYVATELKIQLMLFYLLQKFNIKCVLDESIKEINKIRYLLDLN